MSVGNFSILTHAFSEVAFARSRLWSGAIAAKIAF
jgi:hypothetical protein